MLMNSVIQHMEIGGGFIVIVGWGQGIEESE